ncbi:hypothetical protein DFH09DRAFT_1282326 [Mycena vulgaris]|nr:hypothetical protein DFH09DRAFT_1282326 [Mycena vulgaris]
MPPSSECAFRDLLFRASTKYANWDPEIQMKVGDWGRITRGKRRLPFGRKHGVFVKQGNIYVDGKAEKYGIPSPIEYGDNSGDGGTWIVSQNAVQIDSAAAAGIDPAIAQCRLSGAFQFSAGRGAILVMDNDATTVIDFAGALRPLLEDPKMRGAVVVSEVHSCSSYARVLTDNTGSTIALGLRVDPPVPGVASIAVDARWVTSRTLGNFKSGVSKNGDRKFCPLFRLVSLEETDVAMGLPPMN